MWTRRNPIESVKTTNQPSKDRDRPSRVFQTQQRRNQRQPKQRTCVYCHADDHMPSECHAVRSIEKRKDILASKKLCFNCTGPYHRSSDCKSTATCHHCDKRHHTSICETSRGLKPEGVMTTHPNLVPRVSPLHAPGSERGETLVGAGHVSPREKLDPGRGPSPASLCQNLLSKQASTLLRAAHAKLVQLAMFSSSLHFASFCNIKSVVLRRYTLGRM